MQNKDLCDHLLLLLLLLLLSQNFISNNKIKYVARMLRSSISNKKNNLAKRKGFHLLI